MVTFGANGSANFQPLSLHSGHPYPKIIKSGAPQPRRPLPTPQTPKVSPSASAQPSNYSPASATVDLVNNWQRELSDSVYTYFPDYPCITWDQNDDGITRTWSYADYKYLSDPYAAWPAKGGEDGIAPTAGNDSYPANLYSWLYCGPFNLSDAQNFMAQYALWLNILDPNDRFYFGISTDGTNFSWEFLSGPITMTWHTRTYFFPEVKGINGVYLAWVFISDDNGEAAPGPWLDDLRAWKYSNPSLDCISNEPDPDLNDLSLHKGVKLPPYEQSGADYFPVIRSGEINALQNLADSNAKWVRLTFQQQYGNVDMQAYDIMVDSLCAAGMRVLGLVNNETLVRQDFDNANAAAAYRQEFTDQVRFLVKHFQRRIKYWEVWNEPNFGSGTVPPELYAPLLKDTYNTIKQISTTNQVLFGGLASAWNNSQAYLGVVYQNLGTDSPFDLMAIHPYAKPIANLSQSTYLAPHVYMHLEDPPEMNRLAGDNNILGKFVREMNPRGDGGKHIWITEIGWNSGLGDNRLSCEDVRAVGRFEQALHLKSGFDILFKEIPNEGVASRVKKAFWYQYRDVAIPWPQVCGTLPPPPGGQIIWWYGLYDGNNPPTAKLVQCAFQHYPAVCPNVRRAFIPNLMSGDSSAASQPTQSAK